VKAKRTLSRILSTSFTRLFLTSTLPALKQVSELICDVQLFSRQARVLPVIVLVLLSTLAFMPNPAMAAATYSLDVTPTSDTQHQGESSTFTVMVGDLGTAPEVSLKVVVKPTSLPADQDFTVQFGPTLNPAPYNATLIITSQASTPPNSYLFVVQANNTAAPEVRQVSLTVDVQAGSFTITPTPTSRSISKGDSAEFSLDVAPVGGFSQIAYLNAVPPSGYGITANIAPSQNIPPFTALLRVYSLSTTPSGAFVINIEGRITSVTGPLVYSTGVTLIVGTSNFTVTVSPTTQDAYRGQTVAYNVTVEPVGGFYQPVSLSSPTTSPDLTMSFSPTENVPPFNSTLLVTIGATATPGTFSITVRGTSSGGAVFEAAANVKVLATDFDITVSPSDQGVMRGQTVYFQVNVTTTTSHTAAVDLSVTNLPAGMQAILSKTHGIANFTSGLAVTVTSSAAPGNQLIIVKGTSGGLTNYGGAALFVMLPDFTVDVTPASASISQGESTTFTIDVKTVGFPYTSVVSLKATPPADKEITTSVTPDSSYLNFSATMIVTTSSNTPTGTYVISIAASGSDGISHHALVTLSVGSSSFSVSISPATDSVYQGEGTQFTVTVDKTGTFSESVTLTAAEVSGELSPAVGPSTGTPPFSATLIVSTDLATLPGDYVITVSGKGGGETQEAGAILSVKRTDFSVEVSPTSASIYQSQMATYTLTVSAAPFFPATVVFKTPKISPTAQNVTMVVSPTSGVPGYDSFTADLIVSTGGTTAVNTYTITVDAVVGAGIPTGTWAHSVSVMLTVIEKPPDYYVKVRTSGLTSEGYTTVYVDGKDQDLELNDAANVTEVGPFDGLSTHTIKVESVVDLDTVKFTCDVYSASVSAATKLTFKYQKWYLIEWRTSGLPSGKSVIIKVGSVSHTDTVPLDLETWAKADKSLSFELVSPKSLQVEGKTYTFTRWVNSAGSAISSPITVTKADTFTAEYTRSLFDVVVYDMQGANITLGSTVLLVPAGGSVKFTVKADTYTLSTTQSLSGTTVSGTAFKYWVIPKGSNKTVTANPTSLTVSADIEISVVRSEQVKLSVASPYGIVTGAGWYDVGSTAKFSVDESAPVDSGTRYYCTGYTGDASGSGNSGSIVMNTAKTITFQWKKQFLLTIVSEYGSKSGEGWYDEGVSAQFSVAAVEEAGVRYSFVSWAGDFAGASPSGSIVMNGPKTVTANWKREFKTMLSFVDGDGAPLEKTPSELILSSPSGTVSFTGNFADCWLEEGSWSVVQVTYMGSDVSAGGSYEASAANGSWEIPVRVYSLLVSVKGTLLQSSVSTSTVSVTLPDGSVASSSISSGGQAVLAQLPAGAYQVQATGGITPGTATVQLDQSRSIQVQVMGFTDVGIVVALIIVSIVSAVMYRRWKRTHPKRAAAEEELEEELPPPPPPEEGEALPTSQPTTGEPASLKEFYERSKSK
jgi:hypothetical protein